MNNTTDNEESLLKNVNNAFDYVVKVYEESALLLEDFTTELGKLEFEAMEGNKVGFGRSRSIKSPRNWLTKYITRMFTPKGKSDNKDLLFVTIIYFNLDDSYPKAMTPYLIVGVAENRKDDKKNSRQFKWIYSAFLNEGKKFKYPDNDDIESPEKDWSLDKEWEFTYCGIDKKSKNYPESGKLFAVPLLCVRPEQVEELAKKGKKLWEDKFGKI